jgi:hypothetical protein
MTKRIGIFVIAYNVARRALPAAGRAGANNGAGADTEAQLNASEY